MLSPLYTITPLMNSGVFGTFEKVLNSSISRTLLYFFCTGGGNAPPGPDNTPRGKGWGAAAGNWSIGEAPDCRPPGR